MSIRHIGPVNRRLNPSSVSPSMLLPGQPSGTWGAVSRFAVVRAEASQRVYGLHRSIPNRRLYTTCAPSSLRPTSALLFSSELRQQRLTIPSVMSRSNSTVASGVAPFPASEVAKCTALVALHARLELPAEYELTTLARALNSATSKLAGTFPDNSTLSELGNRLLDFYVSEFIVCSYPRLPMEIIKEARWAYCGDDALTSVGRSWGVEHERPRVVKTGKKVEIKKDQDLIDYFGVLKYGSLVFGRVGGLTEYVDRENEDGTKRAVQRYSTAMSDFVRSIIGGLYLHSGREAAKLFIFNHILSRKLDISKLFRFEQPTRELSRLCAREKLAQPISRMIAETGRSSMGAVYIVGVYSGSNLLGSGEGRSISEAETRAAIHALKAWYLYSPNSAPPSSTEETPEAEFQPLFIDPGQVIV
ncbi:60S ribosomal protein L3 [Myxozyma melibiosi]|uniref:Large ribosomal subunit protein mL44 n=1 Tax=Myxozyma melibiosi TaxID=54550 RepID=A0ABR1FFN9_9ASCO